MSGPRFCALPISRVHGPQRDWTDDRRRAGYPPAGQVYVLTDYAKFDLVAIYNEMSENIGGLKVTVSVFQGDIRDGVP